MNYGCAEDEIMRLLLRPEHKPLDAILNSIQHVSYLAVPLPMVMCLLRKFMLQNSCALFWAAILNMEQKVNTAMSSQIVTESYRECDSINPAAERWNEYKYYTDPQECATEETK